MQKTFKSFDNLQNIVIEPFKRIVKLFESGFDLIKEHFLHEIEPELKKMSYLKKFLE